MLDVLKMQILNRRIKIPFWLLKLFTFLKLKLLNKLSIDGLGSTEAHYKMAPYTPSPRHDKSNQMAKSQQNCGWATHYCGCIHDASGYLLLGKSHYSSKEYKIPKDYFRRYIFLASSWQLYMLLENYVTRGVTMDSMILKRKLDGRTGQIV